MGRQDEVAAVDWIAILWPTPPCTSLHSFGAASSVRYANVNFGDVEAVLGDAGFWRSGEKLGGFVTRWINELSAKEWTKRRDECVAAASEHDDSQTHTEPSAAVFGVGCLLHLLIVAWAGQPSSMGRCFTGVSRSVFWCCLTFYSFYAKLQSMNEYAPRADKLPPDVAKQAARVSEVVAAVKKQIGPDGGRLSDGPLHLERLEELSADDHNSRFTDADDFWKNGMDPSRANPSQDESDTSEKLPSKFVNNFWQYFFPDEMFEKDELLGSVVLSKPPRQRLKLAGGELLTSVQQLFGMLFEDTNIDSHKLVTLESAADEEHLADLKEAMFCSMCWHYIRLLNKMLLRLSAQVRMSVYACRSLI